MKEALFGVNKLIARINTTPMELLYYQLNWFLFFKFLSVAHLECIQKPAQQDVLNANEVAGVLQIIYIIIKFVFTFFSSSSSVDSTIRVIISISCCTFLY